VRPLEFLKFTTQPLAPSPPSSSSASPLPRSSATAGRRAAPLEAPTCFSWPPRVAPKLGHRLSPPPLASPERTTPLPSRQQLLAVAGRHRSPPLPLCRHHLLLWQLPRTAPKPAAALVLLLWPSPTRSMSPRLCPSSTRPPPHCRRG
jgi:hypothetical protein